MAEYENKILGKEPPESTPLMKHTIKDSVFTNLFKDKKYLIQLYQALHPDDKKTTENDIKDITINMDGKHSVSHTNVSCTDIPGIF